MIPMVLPLIAACAPWGKPPMKVPDAVAFGAPYDWQNPFATLIRHERAAPTVYEDRNVVAFMDYAPASPGHVLIISRRSQARNLLEVRDRDLGRLMAAARRIGRAEISGLGADGFTIEQNNGLPQSVPHLHIHVIPRYAGYSRCPGNGLRQPDAVLAPFAARLRAALDADRGAPVPPKPADDLPPPATPPITPPAAEPAPAQAKP